MKQDRSQASGKSSSLLGRLERLVSELNERGETRLEEISRRLRQTEAWLRIHTVMERVERRRAALRERWENLGEALLRRAGIASDRQIEELSEQLRRLGWRLERVSQQVQGGSRPQVDGAARDEDLRSLA